MLIMTIAIVVTVIQASVVEDVKRIRAHPLVPKKIPIYGFYYDVLTGRLVPVPEATEAGKPSA